MDQERTSPFPAMEEEIAAYWKQERIFERSVDERPEQKSYTFYDGPPFATGLPHYGHLLQSALKDAVPRYWTMQGYRVPRRWGWDCHGLPIENLIEKDLKLGSKKQIEAYGIDKFNDACRLSVSTYEMEWERYVERLGRWVDFRNSYKTMNNSYIESVWWVFSELYKQELVSKGVRVSLFCPRCSTPLSNFEIAMGNSYADYEDPAIFIKFPVVGEEKTFFVAWTTTPWSLPGNTGLTVHPELTYVAAKNKTTGETLIFAEARQADVLKDVPEADIEIVSKWKGTELVGKTYEPPYRFLPDDGKAYRVVAGEHVSADDGSGIVHTAPAFGEEDLQMSREHGLPIFDTIDDEGRQIEECGPFAGMKNKESDAPIVEDLRARGFLWRADTINHSVPICWRCNTLLLYKAQPAWFVNITKLKPRMLKTAEKINWHPESFKEGRFGKGLETAPDWNISRSRYWGSPIPVWECESCDERVVVNSIEDLRAKAKPETYPDTLDLHRPGIDNIKLSCTCGHTMHRIPEVFDCWFESGSMPFASAHYPFENRKTLETSFPADFIAEAQDQTRGWFYTLHVLATALTNKPAFSNVIVTGMVLAEDGKKMSKKLKNYPDPWKVLTTYGADALRFYLFTSPIVEADSLNFSERDLQTVQRGFINLLWNVKTFYLTYATDDVRLAKPRSAHVLDRWLFARFEEVLKQTTEAMAGYEVAKATRPLRDFVDDLSTWWLRRSRDRLKSDNEFDRVDAVRTLREILEEFAKVIAPFTPFIAEKVYLDIGGLKSSVHLEKWPKGDDRAFDQRLIDDMRWLREVASKAHELRVQSKLPVRQALGALTIRLSTAEEVARLQTQNDLMKLLAEEVNVEEVRLECMPGEDLWSVILDTEITPALKAKGVRREFGRQVMSLRKAAGLQPTDRIHVFYQGGSAELHEALQGAGDLAKELRAESVSEGSAQGETLQQATVEVGGVEMTIGLVKA